MPWLAEEGEEKPEKGGSGFRGFPSKKMTKTWKEVLPEEESITIEGSTKKIVRTQKVVHHQIEERSSVTQTVGSVSTVESSSASHLETTKEAAADDYEEEEEEEEVLENNIEVSLTLDPKPTFFPCFAVKPILTSELPPFFFYQTVGDEWFSEKDRCTLKT